MSEHDPRTPHAPAAQLPSWPRRSGRVLDSAGFHRAQFVRAALPRLRALRVYVYYLSPYSRSVTLLDLGRGIWLVLASAQVAGTSCPRADTRNIAQLLRAIDTLRYPGVG